MPHDLGSALCLLLVMEGLLLLVAPRQWQDMMREALKLSASTLRVFGALAVVVGLLILQVVR